jgi:Fur family transcriptional regulator, ferric uptake regulator
MQKDKVISILKANELKVTPVRIQVLEVLLESGIALSHTDITNHLGDNTIDKVTLYRTLNHFHKKGLIHKVANEDRNWLYAILLPDFGRPEPDESHAHFICDDCEKIYCFPYGSFGYDNVVSQNNGFIVSKQEIRLHGLCPSCH